MAVSFTSNQNKRVAARGHRTCDIVTCVTWQGIGFLALLYAIKNSLIHESGNPGDRKCG